MTFFATLIVLGIALAVGPTSGPLRVAAAVAMGVVIVFVGLRTLRRYRSIPPEPEIADVSDYGLKYVCGMCGLELRVEVAARDKPPSHCGEPMELVRTGGKPPLRAL